MVVGGFGGGGCFKENPGFVFLKSPGFQQDEEPRISSEWACRCPCPEQRHSSAASVFSHLLRAGLAGWAQGASCLWRLLLRPHPGTCLILPGWCDRSERQGLGKDDLQVLPLVSDSVLILGYWAFDFLNSRPGRILPVRESVQLPAPLPRCLQREGRHSP